MKNLTLIASLFVAVLMMAALAPQARAQDEIEHPDVTIKVDGLACPFCAYGIEKKLKKLEGVEALNVLMDEGEVRIKLKEGATVTEEQIRKAVADAGFTVREIAFAETRKGMPKKVERGL